MCVFLFCTSFIWNIYYSEKYSARFFHKNESVFVYSTRYSCRILMKFEFSRQIFEKAEISSFMKKPTSGSLVVPCGEQTDRQT